MQRYGSGTTSELFCLKRTRAADTNAHFNRHQVLRQPDLSLDSRDLGTTSVNTSRGTRELYNNEDDNG